MLLFVCFGFTIPGLSTADLCGVSSAVCFYLTCACDSSICMEKKRIEMGVSACLLATRSLKRAAKIHVASVVGTNVEISNLLPMPRRSLLLTSSCLLLLTVDSIVP